MQRVILDTNIYGFIVMEKKETKMKIINALNNNPLIRIYGIREIRKEIRKAIEKFRASSTMGILKAYDSITAKEYIVDEKIESIAKEYFLAYSSFGGRRHWKKMRVDFIVVACASIKDIDVIYSDDRESMGKDKKCLLAYQKVNKKHDFRSPNLLRYSDLKNLIGVD